MRDKAAALVGDFGATDGALLDVAAQSPGRPHDLPNPLYPLGWPK